MRELAPDDDEPEEIPAAIIAQALIRAAFVNDGSASASRDTKLLDAVQGALDAGEQRVH